MINRSLIDNQNNAASYSVSQLLNHSSHSVQGVYSFLKGSVDVAMRLNLKSIVHKMAIWHSAALVCCNSG